MAAIGSAGTLVAASLESVGYYYQSFLLDTLASPLTGPVAQLVYVGVVVVMVAKFALTGGAKMSPWLLIGPALFLAILGTRISVAPAEWKFGNNARPQRAVTEAMSGYGVANSSAKVPGIFAHYNRIISGIIAAVVNIVSGSSSDMDSRFVLRAELYGKIRGQGVSHNGVRELIQGPLFSDCREMFESGEKIMDERTRPSQRPAVEERYQIAKQQRIGISKWQQAKDYLTSLRSNSNSLFAVAMDGDAGAVMEKLKAETTPITTADGNAPQRVDETPTVSSSTEAISETYTCDQIWNFVLVGLYTQAGGVVNRALDTGIKSGIKIDQLRKDLAGVGRPGERGNPVDNRVADEFLLRRVASAYLLRNEMRTPSAAAFVTDYANKGFIVPGIRLDGESDMASFERVRLRALESGEKWGMMMTASQLPYFQGVVLYLLSVVFPFFALLLLIPGKYSGFLNWFFLWMWVKSWDIGYAVVMRIDDLLYSLFVTPPQLNVGADIVSVLDALRATDPTFQLATYYSIIGTCLAAIPVVSGQLILKSLQGSANIVSDAVSEFSEFVYQRQTNTGRDPALLGLQREISQSTYKAVERFTHNYRNNTVYPDSAPIEMQNYASNQRALNMSGMDKDIQGHVKKAAWTNALNSTNAYPEYAKVSTALFGSLEKGPLVSSILSHVNGYRGALSGVLGKLQNQRASYLNSVESQGLKIEEAAQQFDAVALNYLAIRTNYEKSNLYGGFSGPQAAPTWFDSQVSQEISQSFQPERVKALTLSMAAEQLKNFSEKGVNNTTLGELVGIVQSLVEGGDVIDDMLNPKIIVADNAQPSNFWSSNIKLISEYGVDRGDHAHMGVDLVAQFGDGTVGAIDSGTVIYSGNLGTYGQTVIIEHANGMKSLYAHMEGNSLTVVEGDNVLANQKLGDIGSTGQSEGPHVHFEMIAGDGSTGYWSVDTGFGHEKDGTPESVKISDSKGMETLLRNKERKHRGATS